MAFPCLLADNIANIRAGYVDVPLEHRITTTELEVDILLVADWLA